MLVASLVASIAIALIGAGTPEVSPGTESSVPIRVVSTTHEVHYPDELLLSLEAESATPITTITLYYRLANQGIRTYGYPEFSSGKLVTADFTLKTGGADFIPTGVEVRYHYEIVDATGNTLVTPTYRVQYRDPKYDWQETRREGFVVLWHDRPAGRVENVVNDVAERLQAVKEMFGLEEIPPIKAVIFSSAREARSGFPFVSEAASSGHLFGGFAFSEYDLFVLGGLNTGGMVHEAAHLMLDAAITFPVMVPSWLNEGLATYFESGTARSDVSLARRARQDSLLRLSYMNTVPGRPSDVRLFYSQARSIVSYMIEAYGEDRMTALLDAMNTGMRTDRAIAWVYGVTLRELEQGWKADLVREAPVAVRPDPGTIFNSTIITGAVVTAVAILTMRWLTRLLRR